MVNYDKELLLILNDTKDLSKIEDLVLLELKKYAEIQKILKQNRFLKYIGLKPNTDNHRNRSIVSMKITYLHHVLEILRNRFAEKKQYKHNGTITRSAGVHICRCLNPEVSKYRYQLYEKINNI